MQAPRLGHHWIHQSEQGLVQRLCVIQQSPDLKGLALHASQQHPVGLGQRVIQQHPSVKPILGVYQQTEWNRDMMRPT